MELIAELISISRNLSARQTAPVENVERLIGARNESGDQRHHDFHERWNLIPHELTKLPTK
jgi:hypothetical protein